MNCPHCGRAFEPLDPRLFSFNSPHGWCPHCRGFGEIWRDYSGKEFDSVLEAELAEERSHEALGDGSATVSGLPGNAHQRNGSQRFPSGSNDYQRDAPGGGQRPRDHSQSQIPWGAKKLPQISLVKSVSASVFFARWAGYTTPRRAARPPPGVVGQRSAGGAAPTGL